YLLYTVVGRRALYFALAPTLAIYATLNFDLLPVALATGGTVAYLRRRDVTSGVLLGLGAAAKLYPALLVIPFVVGRFRGREPDRGIHLAWAAAGAWIAVNLPFALAGTSGWLEFFSFNASRPADWDSLWFLVCEQASGMGCTNTRLVNLGSLGLFIGWVAIVWTIKARRQPGFPRWTLGFPLIVLFLLTNKVYSPQYSVWLLPWFALALPHLRLFLLFEAADMAVFVTRFSWFGLLDGHHNGFAGSPLVAFVGLRVAMFLIGVVGVTLFPPLRAVGVPGWPAPAFEQGWHNAFAAWERFDALWFLRIAEGGYQLRDGRAAFFPLYPLTIRGLSFVLGGHPFAAATIVSNAAFWGGLVVTYLLTTSELSERTARTTVLLMCVFPTAHFFLMPYSESLFLLLSVTAFWGARRRRWWVAGAAGALAALTRSIGVVIAPALVIEALHQRVERRGPAWPGLLAAAATGCGLLVYLGSWGLRAGEWLAPVTFQANWERTFSWPWVTLWDGTGDAFRYLDEINGGYW